ncbi:type I-U CRISPR-associated protein Cas7 [Methanoculleus bourgensis]|jgi:CRISPR-associated protein Csb1|nr:type I-U CRISPR-associated protein Cas7 [Methanoculleus bourgensis]NMA88882.1 type I-U CRISPR-associated protein Cas7 [Methanoculleus bourgensis]
MTGISHEMEKLKGVPRLLLEVELQPVQGDRFQPTGFPDLGAAIYERPDGTRMILVESSQSVANRLEQTCLEGSGPRIALELAGLPYITAKLDGAVETETSSLVEAHRINSPFIITNKEFKEAFKKKAEYEKGKPLNWKKIAEAFFFYDPNSLLHGAFMANLEDGRVKVQRALSGFIEAEGIREAASGGVKNNPLDPTGKLRVSDYDENVYGNVPYHRMEFTADRIVAYFNFDLALLEGYGLDREAKELLVALGLYKVCRFLGSGLRLRTACDLAPKDGISVTAPEGFTVPDEESLLEYIQEKIRACTEKKLFADPPVTVLKSDVIWKEEKKETVSEEGETEP